MSAIVWWVIPAGSVLVAIAWVAWISRERPRADPQESVESYHRFQQAIQRDLVARARSSPQTDPPEQASARGTRERVAPGRGALVRHRRRPTSGS